MVENGLEINQDVEDLRAEEILKRALETFSNRIAIASSFGAEDMVLIDMAVKLKSSVRIFTIDTGRLPQETYDLIEKTLKKYDCVIETYFPEKEQLEKLVREHGPNPFYKSVELRQLCCKARKVEPLQRALSSLDAWICGLRREQSVTRSGIRKVEKDEANGGILKINPLAEWSNKDVWNYIRNHRVPYNKLHDEGYPSIGCVPCTRAVAPEEDIRAGRWWWERPEEKECGLHKGR